MRGAQGEHDGDNDRAGIIPADAGSTASPPSAMAWVRDHPRGCGEHLPPCKDPMRRAGSSPRMRGALGLAHAHVPFDGIIPADAGSTICNPSITIDTKDHPRGCGEHSDDTIGERLVSGSSPRMRGARNDEPCHCRTVRIIPADAGSTDPSVPQFDDD